MECRSPAARQEAGAMTEYFDPKRLPANPVLAGFFVFCLATAFIILALSAYTYQLDDIKLVGLYAGGALALAVWCLLWFFRYIQTPPAIVWIPYASYLAVCLVSTLFAEKFARWIGWQYVPYYTSAFGFVLLGSAVVQTKRMVEWSLKFWILVTLITTVFGLLHYAGHLERLYDYLYAGAAPASDNRFHDLLYTFRSTRSMLSTVLNVQFFGNFLLMLLPVCVAGGMVTFQNLQRRITEKDIGLRIAMSALWLVGAGLAIVLSLACIFTTFSKSSLFALPFILVLFFGAVYLFANVRRIPYLGLMIGLGAVMAATVLFFTWGDLQNQLKNIDESMGPRRIIFGGALNIFADHPILGGGPGSFRLLFPEYRAPDYHLHRVSNLTLYSHNWVLDLLAETGVLGAVAYLAFLLGVFYLGYKSLRRCPDVTLRVAIIGCLVGVLSILGGALVTPMTRWPVGTAALHAMIGTALGVILMAGSEPDSKLSKTERRKRQYDRRPPITWTPRQTARAALLCGTLVFLVVASSMSIRMFRASVYHGIGWKNSQIPDSYLNPSGVAEDPAVIAILKRAVENFERAIEIDPTRLTTYYRLASVYHRLGMYDEALKAYHDMQEYGPDYSEVHMNLGIIYYSLASELDARLQNTGDFSKQEAEELRKQVVDYFRESSRHFDKAAEMNAKVTVWYYQAYTHLHVAERLPTGSEEAAKEFARAGEVYRQTAELPLSQVIQEENQTTMEEEQRFQALKLAPSAFEQAGKPLLAAEAVERYLEREPTSLTALNDAVRLYIGADESDEALRLVDEALSRNPLSAEVLLLKIDILNKIGRTEDAEVESKYALFLDREIEEKGGNLLTESVESRLRERLKSQ